MSFSGPKYMVQEIDMNMMKDPMKPPNVGVTLDDAIPHNCDNATCHDIKYIHFYFIYLIK